MSGEPLKCPNCKAPIKNKSDYCKKCGMRLFFRCQKCGTRWPRQEDSLCPRCGERTAD